MSTSSCAPQIFGIQALQKNAPRDASSFSLINSFAGSIYFDGGSGGELSPFLICTREEWTAIQILSSTDGKYFKQICDIDLGGFSAPTPTLNSFSGNYNGNGYKIFNGLIESTSATTVGLFGAVGATGNIHDLKVDSIKVQSYGLASGLGQPTGTIAGTSKGTIKNVIITNANVACTGQCGGIVGDMSDNALLESSYFDGNVAGMGYDSGYAIYGIGGLVGHIISSNPKQATIQYNMSKGTLSGNSDMGGIIGNDESTNAIIRENITAMNISITPSSWGGWGIGGIVGNASGNFTGNYNVGSLVNNSSAGNVSGVSGLFGSQFATTDGNYAALLGMEDYNTAGDFSANGSTDDSYFYNHALIHATNDQGALSYVQMTDVTGASFSGFDFLNTWTLPNAALPFPFPQLRSFSFSALHTFEMTPYTPLQIVEVPDVTTGETFGTQNASTLIAVGATLTLHNTSGGSITIDSAEMAIGRKISFVSGPSTCDPSTVLAPAATCTLIVRLRQRYTPGTHVADSIIVKYTDASAVSRVIAHQVDATITLDDAIIPDSSPLLSATLVGNTSHQVISLTNIGTTAVTLINSLTSNSPDLVINAGPSTCDVGGGVLGGALCTLDLSFAPSSLGNKNILLTVNYNTAAGVTKNAYVYLTGYVSTSYDGTLAHPFEIWNTQDLAGMDLTGEYHQKINLDLSPFVCGSFGLVPNFNGTYDGENFQISNYCANTGLFGQPADDTMIRNLKIDQFTVGEANVWLKVGALADSMTGGSLNTIEATNIKLATQDGDLGGLVATTNGTDLSYCSVSGASEITVYNTMGTASFLGGLVGEFINGTIDHSFTNVKLYQMNSIGNPYIGGLIGTGNSTVTISDSYATGDISVENGGFIGGLAGFLWGNTNTISRSFTTGTLDGAIRVAGLTNVNISSIAQNLVVEESFSSSPLTGVSVSGLVQNIPGTTNLTIQNSFYSGVIDSSGFGYGISNHTETGGDNYVSSPSITDSIYPGGNGYTLDDIMTGESFYYFENGLGFQTFGATPLNAIQMEDEAEFVGFDFPAKWRMPVHNPFSTVNSPVPSWLCGKHGVTCY